VLRRGSPVRRLYLTLACIVAAMALLGARLVQMQGLDFGVYRTEAAQHWLKTIPIPAARGSITASNGAVLAMTVQTDVVFADPVQISQQDRATYAAKLAGPLRMSQQAIVNLIDNPTSPQYVVLAKVVSAPVASRIANMDLLGIGLTPSYSTVYPDGDLASDVVGFTDVDAGGTLVGEAGVEQAYNKLLSGRPGSQVVETGPDQVPVPLSQARVKPAVAAGNLRLTIQPDIQYEAEQQCKLRLALTRARSCSVVVMQPSTGRILAMAQWPTYNPAAPASLRATHDIGVSNVFAPGSTLKPVTVAAALERGGQTPMTAYTIPYSIDIDGYQFHDA
jgi:cell division protein FtsI (penicillin-binding protein 3)